MAIVPQVIGNTTYSVTQLTWGKSNALWVRLLNALGPSVGKLAGGWDPKKGVLGNDVGPAIERLSRDLSADDIEAVVNTLLEAQTIRMTRDGKSPILDREKWELHFTGKYLESLKVIAFALEVNFGDFLGGLQDALASKGEAPAAPEPSSSESPQASTGTSGES
jgi:hypothetical protein